MVGGKHIWGQLQIKAVICRGSVFLEARGVADSCLGVLDRDKEEKESFAYENSIGKTSAEHTENSESL